MPSLNGHLQEREQMTPEPSATRSSIRPDAWALDPAVTFLNHGSFGACPLVVLERQQRLRLEMEREPVEFLVRKLTPLLDESRNALAELIGADPADVVFVQNATAGVNSVLRSLDFSAGRRNPRDHARLQRLPQRGPLRGRAERGGGGRGRRAAADRLAAASDRRRAGAGHRPDAAGHARSHHQPHGDRLSDRGTGART